MKPRKAMFWILLGLTLSAASWVRASESEPIGPGPWPVGNTNFQMSDAFAAFSDDQVREWLTGFREDGRRHFFSEHLAWPKDAWIIDVAVPDEPETYASLAGQSIPVVIYLSYPTSADNHRPDYRFPFPDSDKTLLRHMQGPGDPPLFADPSERYPLVLISHGRNVHGIWEIDHAQRLASHGYVTLTMNFGDPRISSSEHPLLDTLFRPLAARTALDAVLASDEFGAHIDATRIATSGHSAGGYTSLALAGGRYLRNSHNYHHPGVAAVVTAAPWVGGTLPDRGAYFLFGENNSGVSAISAPVFAVFGTRDQATPASSILPALEQLSGPRYVVELVDQPHIFEAGSWQDLAAWELLFLDAYIKGNQQSLRKLGVTRSMKGGNADLQHFDRQRHSTRAARSHTQENE